MAAVRSVIAVGFGKVVFGGFGMNPFNPSLVSRIFLIYIISQTDRYTGWIN